MRLDHHVIFTTGEPIATYDVVWSFTPEFGAFIGFRGETMTFYRSETRSPSAPQSTEPTSSGDNSPSSPIPGSPSTTTPFPIPEYPETQIDPGALPPKYRGVFHWGSGDFGIIYDCTALEDEMTFSNFELVGWNENVDDDGHQEDMRFEFVDVLDDNGFPFLKWRFECGENHGVYEWIDGWAKRRDDEDDEAEDHPIISTVEKERLKEWGCEEIFEETTEL